MAGSLAQAQAWFRDWMFGCALPFWAAAGHEGTAGGASEFLQLDGSPGHAPFKRMRVQARQIYVFSQAALLGWAPGEQLARDGYRFITAAGQHPDGFWARRLAPNGQTVLDPAADLYDQAFVLFALAWYARLGTGEGALPRARRTVEWLRAHMATPGGGFHNVLPPEPGPRLQNPHMHLLEAALALHQTAPDPLYASLAHDLVALLQTRLFEPACGAIGEAFAPDWTPVPGGPLEPGHQFEWVWLLDAYERLLGGTATAEIAALYRAASTFGTHPATGLVLDAVDRTGRVLRGSARLWPQAEAVKAQIVMARRGAATEAAMLTTVANLRTRYLAGCPSGAWIDQLDDQFRPISTSIPTSSFYHLMMAYAELAAPP